MEKVRIEVEFEGSPDSKLIELVDVGLEQVLSEIRSAAALEGGHIFERDQEEPVGPEIGGKKVLSIVVHRCRKIHVKVHYDHESKENHFSPAATVFRVLQWAISKKAFNLDEVARAKANLMLPGAAGPLAKDAVIGSLSKHGDCALTLDLTLKDFTNG
jgi:hypothetical protein